MYNIYFTSDLHFGHDKDFMYVPRGFSSIEEHDNAIIRNWNETVRPQDYVYILGDLVLGDLDKGLEKLNKLNGAKYMIRGNHDTENKIDRYYIETDIMPMESDEYTLASTFQIGKWNFYLSHYPVCLNDYRCASSSRKWCLCGHSHTKNKWQDIERCSYHVELDCHDNRPVSLDEIKKDINWFKALSDEEKIKLINN